MKSSDLKVVAIILSIALFFTIITSNAVSIASVVILAKGGTGTQTQTVAPGTGDVQQQQSTTNNGGYTDNSGNQGSTVTPGTSTPAGDANTNTNTDSNANNNANTNNNANANNNANTNNNANANNNTNNNANANNNSNQWSKEQTFEFYKKSAHEMATTGKAAYNKIEWQVLENLKVGSVGGLLQPVIDNFMTTEEEAEVQVQAKGSDDAKNRFPDCTLTDMSKVASATKKDLPNGNYEITIIMMDEDTPMNEESSFLAKVTTSVLFWEDIQRTIDEDVPVVSAVNSRSVNYKGYKIVAEMTKDGKFVSLGHYATVEIAANAKIGFNIDIGGTLYNNCKYSEFQY